MPPPRNLPGPGIEPISCVGRRVLYREDFLGGPLGTAFVLYICESICSYVFLELNTTGPLNASRDWGQEEKGMTEDEMAGWRHRLDGHEFE